MHHKPRRFLRDADSPVNLIRANAVLCSRQHPCCRQPLVQPKRRVLVDRSRFRGELPFRMIASALPLPLVLEEGSVLPATHAASDAFGPETRNHVGQAVVGVAAIDNALLECFRFFYRAFHALSIALSAAFVDYILALVN